MNETSSVNTILIVLLIALIVGGLVWFFAARTPVGQTAPSDLKVDVKLPDTTPGSNTGGGNTSGGSQTPTQ